MKKSITTFPFKIFFLVTGKNITIITFPPCSSTITIILITEFKSKQKLFPNFPMHEVEQFPVS